IVNPNQTLIITTLIGPPETPSPEPATVTIVAFVCPSVSATSLTLEPTAAVAADCQPASSGAFTILNLETGKTHAVLIGTDGNVPALLAAGYYTVSDGTGNSVGFGLNDGQHVEIRAINPVPSGQVTIQSFLCDPAAAPIQFLVNPSDAPGPDCIAYAAQS